MTNPDPFGAIAAPAPAGAATAVMDDLIGNVEGYDPLFGEEKLISLFDKTIGVGVSRTGIITKAPEDRQSRFFKAGGAGALKFWSPQGSEKPVTDKPVGPNGETLRPCMDTVFVLDTDYRLTGPELAERNMDEDNGQRGVFASGAQLKAIRQAIKDARVSSRAQLAGMRLTLVRTGKRPAGDYEAWTWAAKLER